MGLILSHGLPSCRAAGHMKKILIGMAYAGTVLPNAGSCFLNMLHCFILLILNTDMRSLLGLGMQLEGTQLAGNCARTETKESCSKLPLLATQWSSLLGYVGVSIHLLIYVYVAVITLPLLCPSTIYPYTYLCAHL